MPYSDDNNDTRNSSLANLVSRFVYDVNSVDNIQADAKNNMSAVSSSFIGSTFGKIFQYSLGVSGSSNTEYVINQKLIPLKQEMTVLDSIQTLDKNINFVDSKIRLLNQNVQKNTDLTTTLLDFSKKLYNSFSQQNAKDDFARYKKTENKFEKGFDEHELEERISKLLQKNNVINLTRNNYRSGSNGNGGFNGSGTAAETGTAEATGTDVAADVTAGAIGGSVTAGLGTAALVAIAALLGYDAYKNTVKTAAAGEGDVFRKFIEKAKTSGYIPGKTYFDPKTGKFLPIPDANTSTDMSKMKLTSQTDWANPYFNLKSIYEKLKNNTVDENDIKEALRNSDILGNLNHQNDIFNSVTKTSKDEHNEHFDRGNSLNENDIQNLRGYIDRTLSFKLGNIVNTTLSHLTQDQALQQALVSHIKKHQEEQSKQYNDLIIDDFYNSVAGKPGSLRSFDLNDYVAKKRNDINNNNVITQDFNQTQNENQGSLKGFDFGSYAAKKSNDPNDVISNDFNAAQNDSQGSLKGFDFGSYAAKKPSGLNNIGKRFKRFKGNPRHNFDPFKSASLFSEPNDGYQVASLESDIGGDFYEPPKVDQEQINTQFKLNTTEAEKSGKFAAPSDFSGVFDDYSITSTSFKLNSEKANINLNQNFSLDVSQDIVIKSLQSITLDAPLINIVGKLLTADPSSVNTTSDGQLSNNNQGITPLSFGPNTVSNLPSGGNNFTPGTQGKAVPSGSYSDGSKAAQAYRYFLSQGWSPTAASGIIGSMQQESGVNLNESIANSSSGNYGIAQWGQARRALFQKVFGHSINGSTFQEQLEFVNWELKNTEKNAGEKIAGASSPEQAALYASEYYERPGAWEANNAQRERYAKQIADNAGSYTESKGQTGSNTAKNIGTSSSQTSDSKFSGNDSELPSAISSTHANYMKIGSQWGNPETSDWASENLTTILTPAGKKVTVNKAAGPAFEGFLKDLAAEGYTLGDVEGYNNRDIRGSSTISQHAFGNAIDINPGANPMGYGAMKTNLPANVGQLAAKWGLVWGGNFRGRKDPMHFEWTGAPLPSQTQTASSSTLRNSTGSSSYADLAKKTGKAQTGIDLSSAATTNIGDTLTQKPNPKMPRTTSTASQDMTYPTHIDNHKNTHDNVNMSAGWLADYSSAMLT